MTLAVCPATIVYGYIFFVTTLFAPTSDFFPIVTPGNIVTFSAIQHPSSIFTGLDFNFCFEYVN